MIIKSVLLLFIKETKQKMAADGATPPLTDGAATDVSWVWDLYPGATEEIARFMRTDPEGVPFYLIAQLKKRWCEMSVGHPLPFFPPAQLRDIIKKECLSQVNPASDSIERLGEIVYGPYEDPSYDPNFDPHVDKKPKGGVFDPQKVALKWIKENGDYEHRYSIWCVTPFSSKKWKVEHVSSWDVQHLPGHPDCMIKYGLFLPPSYSISERTMGLIFRNFTGPNV